MAWVGALVAVTQARLGGGGGTAVLADALLTPCAPSHPHPQGDLRAEHVMPSTGDSTTARSFLGRVAAGGGGLASIPEYAGAAAASTSAEGDDTGGGSVFGQY